MTRTEPARIAAHVRAVSERLGACVTISQVRQAYETYPLHPTLLPDVRSLEVDAPRGYWIGRTEFDPRRRGVYFHGGGFVAGSFGMYAGLISRIADATRSWIFFCDYPRAPERLFPAGHAAAIGACDYARHNGPNGPGAASQLFAVGDSSGGGMVFAVAMHLRDQGRGHLLDALIGLSPMLDLTAAGSSYTRCAATDALVSAQSARQCAGGYAPGIDSLDPRLSPLFGSFEKLPPVMLQVSDDEVVCDDSTSAAHAIEHCGGKVELQRWPGLPHVWHLLAGSLQEADEAIVRIGAFVDRESRR